MLIYIEKGHDSLNIKTILIEPKENKRKKQNNLTNFQQGGHSTYSTACANLLSDPKFYKVATPSVTTAFTLVKHLKASLCLFLVDAAFGLVTEGKFKPV